MARFYPALVSGMATGAIYALAALGFTLLWQASGTINFAQGEFVMLPAFAMLAGIAFGAAAVGWRFSCLWLRRAPARLGFKLRDRRSADPPRRHAAGDRHHRGRAIRCAMACAQATARRRIHSRSPFASRSSSPRRHQRFVRPTSARWSWRRSRSSSACRCSSTGPSPAARCRRSRRTPIGRAHARHRRRPHGALHVPDQCGARRRRRVAGHADLSREIRHGRLDRPHGVHRGDHRRLQPDARRASRRPV